MNYILIPVLVVLVALLTEMLDLDIADALIAGGLSWLAVQLVGAYFLFA